MSIDPNLFGNPGPSYHRPHLAKIPTVPTIDLAALPRKARRLCLEVVGFSVAGFALMVVLANSSGGLRDYRAFFLSSAKDTAVVGLLGAAAYRILRGQNEPTQNRQKPGVRLHAHLHFGSDNSMDRWGK